MAWCRRCSGDRVEHLAAIAVAMRPVARAHRAERVERTGPEDRLVERADQDVIDARIVGPADQEDEGLQVPRIVLARQQRLVHVERMGPELLHRRHHIAAQLVRIVVAAAVADRLGDRVRGEQVAVAGAGPILAGAEVDIVAVGIRAGTDRRGGICDAARSSRRPTGSSRRGPGATPIRPASPPLRSTSRRRSPASRSRAGPTRKACAPDHGAVRQAAIGHAPSCCIRRARRGSGANHISATMT
jgi:hypothetical protein